MYYLEENMKVINIPNKNFNYFQEYTYQAYNQYDRVNKFY